MVVMKRYKDTKKKQKDTKKCAINRKFKSEDYKHSLEATHPKDRINHLEKN